MLLLIGTAAFAQQWQTLPVAGQLPANGVSHSAIFDPVTNKLIVYGGTVANLVPQNDVWILSNANGSSGPATWAKLATSGGPARWAHSAAYDATNKRMMVFGGIDESIVRSSEAWVLSNADGTTGTPAWTKVASAGSGPVARREAYASYDSASNRLIVFGGEDQSARELNDVWVLSNANGLGGTAAWTQLTPAGPLPTIRGYGASVYDPSTNRLIIYGGTSTYDPETMLGDVWVLTNANGQGGTPAWIHLNPNTASGAPAARSLPAMIYDSALNRAVIFGGYTTCSNAGPCIVTSDAWVLQNATGTDLTPTAWIPLSPSGTPSQNASFSPGVFDPVTDQLIAANDLTSIWLLSNPSARRIKTYDATPGTTPPVQGWPYSGDNGNPAPTVSGGALIENTTAGAQYWSQADSTLDLSQSAVLEAVIKIDSSNYIANIGTGTREGYYLGVGDAVSGYTIGLTDTGFNINSITVPNQNLTPFPIDGAFHTYRLVIQNRLATFSIDGVMLASNIQPTISGSFGPRVAFGGLAGASRSVSELRFLCYGYTSTDCALALPDLTISKSHSGNFTQGQTGATYSISISNGGSGPTVGTVSVTDTLPTALTVTALAGPGWSCTLGTLTCTRSDALAASASYPAITLTVNVASNAPTSVTNMVTVSGGGDSNSSNNSASNQTTITSASVPDLTVTKTHTGSFTQGQTGATYSITVSNRGTGPTSGAVTATDTLPTGLTATGLAGSGWSCTLATLSCTRSDALVTTATYPPITLTVNVANNVAASVTNIAVVSGGGELNTANDSASDLTTIVQLGTTNLAFRKSATQSSTYAGYSSDVAASAVDGNTDGNFYDGSVTHTDPDANAWWQVDLGASATVSSVVVWNRTDCCGDRLSDYWVFVSNVPFGSTDTPSTLQNRAGTWSSHQTAAPNPSTNIAVPGAQGQFVRVQLSGANYLSLAEVQVMGTLNGLANPDLTITKSHAGNFIQGQIGATYTITVTNSGSAPTFGAVTVTDTLPIGLTAAAISGTGWNCTLTTATCTRADALGASASYPTITLMVNVASNAAASVTNTATVSGGGELKTANNTASDVTTITPAGECVAPAAGLVHWWPGDGNSNDLVGGTPGTLQNGATFALGEVGQAFRFNGSSSFVSLGTGPSIVGPGPFSLDAWVQSTSSAGVIIQQRDAVSDPNGEYILSIGGISGFGFAAAPGKICWTTFGDGAFGFNFCSSKSVNDGLFHHIAATRETDGSGVIYIDGIRDSSALAPARTLASLNVFLGADKRDNTLFLSGLVDEAQIFNRALSASEIQAIFAAGSAGECKGSTTQPDLTISKTHVGNFVQGQTAAAYTITASNVGATATTGQVTVIDTLPTGLTATAISGTGWTCVLGTLTCTRSDALAASVGYPAITVTVNVASNAPASVTNTATVSGGGEINTSNDTSKDVTTITPPSDLTITKTHVGNFVQGQTGAIYTITASNLGPGSTTGQVTVADTLPAALTATAISGTGWTCVIGTLTCTRSDALAGGASYPAIMLTVTVAGNAPASVTNTAVVSGGGELNTANDTANDPTTIAPPPDLTVSKSHTGNITEGQTGVTFTITVSNVGQGPTSGTVTAVDTLPTGLTATAIGGTGWTCVLGTVTCTRSDTLAAGASYPVIILTVNVASNAPASVTNAVVVSGGGEFNTANDTANDVATVAPAGGISATPAALDFGAVPITTSSTKSVTITSTGLNPLTISSIVVGGNFYTLSNLPSLPAVVPPAGTVSFSVTFAPLGTISAPGTVTLTSNATTSSTTISLSGSGTPPPLPPAAAITLITDQAVYRRGQPVRISGKVTAANGSGISNVPVAVQVSLNGTVRPFNPYTDAQGGYQVVFQPTSTDGGAFSVTATGTSGGATQTATKNFRIVGLLVSQNSVSQDQVMGSTVIVPLTLQNVGDATLSNLTYAVTVTPTGLLGATFSQSVASLNPGATGTVAVVLTAPTGNPPPMPVGVQVNITATDSSSGISDQESSSFVITLRPAVSTPMLTPTSLTVGVNPGKSLTRHFVVKNGGYLPMNNATVTLQDPLTFNWVSLGNANLGNLAAGDSRQFDVMINPPANLALTTYAVVFNVSGGTTPLQGTVNISVTQSTMGSAAFVVSDDIGAKVGGATVSLYGKTNGKMFQGVTGSDGSAFIGGVDAGDYSYVVAAPSHDPGTGSVTVTANASALINVLLSYNVVTLTFTVTPTTIVDQYNVTLNITYSTTLPKPALQVFPYSLDLSFFPENAPNGQLACALSITNTHPTASVRNLSVDASQLDVSQPNGQRIHVLFANGVTVYQIGNLAGKATANVPCYATLDGGAVPTHSAGNIVVQANYDFSLDGQVLQGTTTTNVPVNYTRPSDLSYNPVRFIYDKKTDPANPVLKYDAGSFVYNVTSNRTPVLNLLKPSGALFAGRNLVAFTQTQGASTSIDVINANSGNVFWRTDFSSLKQSLLGNGDMTTYDISTLDGGLTLQQVLAAQVAINPAQALNQPTYLGFEGQWADATTPGGYLIPVQITTLDSAGITIPRPPAGPTTGCLNPEDPQCKDPNPTFQAPVPSQDGQILLAFDQTIRLERQAFNAMLGIGARAPLMNTVASIQIRDASGNDASSKFFVLVTSDAMGATHGGTVSGQANVSWQLIPNAAAGGTSAQGTQYQVQARLNYVVSGTAKSASTQVVTITVLPSPKLTVAYSAPFVVMAGKEAKIRVTLQNVGYGIARNLSIQSAQPRITASIPANPLDQLLDNPGPLVAFNLTGSSNTADGAGFQAGNLTINFGNVAPGATVSGYWTLQVSQKGFFIDINSTFTHTDYQGIQLDPLIVTPTTTLVPAIGGTITAGSGQGIPNLTVSLLQAGVAKGTDTTDISGVYYISDLAPGTYLEQVTDLTGNVLASKNITVLGDQGTNFIDFTFQNYNPTQALILVNTNPPGLLFTADGVTYTTPQSFVWAVNSTHTLGVSSATGSQLTGKVQTQKLSLQAATASGAQPVFVGWGDGETSLTRSVTVNGFGAIYQPLTVSSDTYNRYSRTAVTPDPTFPNDDRIDHKWPSRNNRGDMVWSQKDPNNPSAPWQVWEQPSGGLRKPITFDQHSHERPVISDNGTIAWFQDSTGGGLGSAIMRLDPGSNSPSTIEYSSRKLCQTIYDSTGHPISSTCAPPQDAQEHDAGKNFGISSDGRTISYFTFFDNGDPTDRPFDINGQPLKDSSGNKVQFIGYDSPDLNANSALVYSDDFRGLGNIYLGTLTQPLTSTTIDGPGNPQRDSGPQPLPAANRAAPPLAQFPHISDSLKPEVAYLKNKVNVNHWPGADPAKWVDLGLWTDVAGSGKNAIIAYERVVNGHSQIWLAKPSVGGTINATTNLASATFTIAGATTYSGTGQSFMQSNAPAGSYTITFGPVSGYTAPPPQSQTLADGGAITFNGTYKPQYTLKIACTGCAQQIGNPGEQLRNPLVVQVADQAGNPKAGISINFTLSQQSAGATLTAANATTLPADGTASTQLTLGTIRGRYQVTASCTNVGCSPSSVVFEAQFPFEVTMLDPVTRSGSTSLLIGTAATSVYITADPAILSGGGTPVQGVAADGVAQIALKILANIPNEQLDVSISSGTGSANKDGRLGQVGSNPNFGPSTYAIADSTGTPLAFAVYRAPLDFTDPGDTTSALVSRTLTIRIQSHGTAFVSDISVNVVRPPVVLVHGNWSNPTNDWAFFQFSQSPPLFQTYKADYSAFLDRGVLASASVVLSQVYQFIAAFKQGAPTQDGFTVPVAAIQADLVGYSLGGLVSRALVTRRDYASVFNYSAGYVHKLITLDTPHLGSEFARRLLASPACQTLFATFVGPVDQNVRDMVPNSPLLNLLATPSAGLHLPTAVIASNAEAAQLDKANAKYLSSVLNQILHIIPGPCRNLLPPGGYQEVFPNGSDLIVSTSSQLATGLGLGGVVIPAGVFSGFPGIHSVDASLFPLGPDVRQSTLNAKGARVGVLAPFPSTEQVVRFLNTPVNSFAPIAP